MPVTIDVVSDFACPWCRLGKMRLDRAMERFSERYPRTPLHVNWLPYLMSPPVRVTGEPYRPFLERQLGGAAAVDRMWAAVREEAATEGIAFDFERIKRQPNTLRAHRLMYRAQSLGFEPRRINALVDALFAGHFERGEDIGDVETLVAYATQGGDQREAVMDYLQTQRDAGTVRRMADQLRRQGVDAAPFFIIDRMLGVSGAQSVTALEAALQQVAGAAFHA